MRRLFGPFAAVAIALLVFASHNVDAGRRRKRGRDGKDSEECDEFGRPLQPLQPRANRQPPPHAQPDVSGAGFMDFWPLGINQGVQEWEKDDFWPEMDDELAKIFKLLMKGGDFGIKKGWDKDWSLEELEREMKEKMTSPKAAEEIIQSFRANEDEFKRMVEKMRHREKPKEQHGPPYKTITVALCAVLGVVLLTIVGVACYRRAGLRARVAPPSPAVTDSSAKYEMPQRSTDGEKEPLPPCPAYMIAGAPPPVCAPPPVYCLAAAPGDGPPTYSTIDLQDESSDAPVVTVKPM